MSIGEKILQARKDAGLSQEQLAQQMGIELESLSRWEDETELPDRQQTELLEQILAAQLREELPLEEISYVHKSEHLGQLGKEFGGFHAAGKRNLLIIVAVFVALMPFSSGLFFVGLGMLIFALIFFSADKLIDKKRWKKQRVYYEGAEFTLRIFADRFEQIRRKDGEETVNRVELDQVRLAKTGAFYTILETERTLYSIPRSALEKSDILSRVAEDRRKRFRRETKLQALYVCLFMLSLTSVAVVYGDFFDFWDRVNGKIYGIIALALTILPIASIVVCLKLKSGTRAKVLGTIWSVCVIIALLIPGGLALVLSTVHGGGEEKLDQLEEFTDIYVPEYASIKEKNYSDKEYEGGSMRPQEHWIFVFDEYKAQGLDSQLAKSKIWRESSNPTLDTIIDGHLLVEGWDYFAVYEPETGRVNRRPEENGTYTFFVASYDRDKGVLCIVQYELDYKK